MTAVTPTIQWQGIGSFVWGGPWNATEASQWTHLERAAMPSPAHLPAVGWSMQIGVGVLGQLESDPYPAGHLVFTIAPTTGVTMQDWNYDSQQTNTYTGNGQAICNFSGQAEGAVWLTFADAGTFTLSAEYISTDANYSSVKLATPLEIVVA